MARRAVLVANAVAALVTPAFSVAVPADPAIGLPAGVDVTPGAALYGHATALRSIALAAVLLVLARARTQLVPLLVVAGLTQLADAVLHLAYGAPAPAVWALGPRRGAARIASTRRAESERTSGALTWEHDYHDD
jgi:hypothetical protein